MNKDINNRDMAMTNKPEIYLEIGASFFRIPTPEANYNITVLGSQETSVTRFVDKIVEKEKNEVPVYEESAMAAVSAGLAAAGTDDFYREVSSEIYRDIGQLAKNLSVTIMDIPAEDRLRKRVELDEAGDKIEDAKNQLKDIVEMTERAAMQIMDKVEDVQGGTDNVKNLLSDLKHHPAFSIAEPAAESDGLEAACPITGETEALQKMINQALDLLTAMQEQGGAGAAAPPEVKKEKKTRYLFDLDVVFQTLYELCTNEAVKEHITKAREKAADIFVLDTFHDAISSKAVKYVADSDNFYTVPMSDVFASLFKACNDKGISNLLKKMDAGQSSIFLDQTIPLAVPPVEVIEVASAATPEPAPAAALAAPPDSRVGEVKELLAKAIEGLDKLPEKTHGMRLPTGYSTMTLEDQREIFKRIEDAFAIAANISSDVSKITEALSFQDLSGQQIMKIIKLLSDFQIQLLALVVSFGSQLKHKERNKDITVEESKKLAQEDVDSYINKLSGTSKEAGMLDQLTVNKMLEEMGF
jgi:chemotaxis regulatin CheY-phosphate phosphatase CheZ